MSKTLVIAVREYLAAVKTKGFLVGLIMMPLLMGGGVVLQAMTKTIESPASGSIAVLDRTADKKVWAVLKEAADKLEDTARHAKRIVATYKLEPIDIPSDPVALDSIRLTLADRVRAGKLTAIVEAGPNALAKRDPPMPRTPPFAATPAGARRAAEYPPAADNADDAIFFTTNRPALTELRAFVENGIRPAVIAARLEQSPDTVRAVLRSAEGVLFSRGLAQRTMNGEISFEPRSNEIATLMLPVAMVVVMLMVVLVGASPLTTNIIEEKQLRIAEVLVGSVTPFTLMLGKLLGGVATSLTLGVIYIGGAAAVASKMGMFEIVTPGLVIWFMVFTVIGSLMYGACSSSPGRPSRM
ncbi:MAG: ABC transporter permease [Tepidisphaeraceae bacterium]